VLFRSRNQTTLHELSFRMSSRNGPFLLDPSEQECCVWKAWCHGQSVVTPFYGMFLIFWGATHYPGSMMAKAYLITVGALLPIWSYVSYRLIKRTVPHAKRYLVILGLFLCVLYSGVLFISFQQMANSYNLTATLVAGLSLMETLAFTVVVSVCQAADDSVENSSLILVRETAELHQLTPSFDSGNYV